MIIFHEGMPRSGKSYSAVKDHLIPALAAGRRCYVRLDGLNFPKLAELAGRTLTECRELLSELSEEQCQRFTENEFDKDSFIFVDEAQNYWPRQRKPLEPDMMKWIAEHGHHGHDVLLMGQLAKDVHTAWINRVNRKLQFIKKDVVGKVDEYKWIMFHGSPDANGNVKFREVQKGDAKYEEKYFGTYQSHSDGTENKANYNDDRANIWKSPVFRKWIPIYCVCALVGLGYIIYAFNGGLVKDPKKEPVKEAAAKPQATPETRTEVRTVPAPQIAPSVPTQAATSQENREGKLIGTRPEIIPVNQLQPVSSPDYIEQLSSRYRVRLGGLIKGRKHMEGIIEWRDESDGVKEVLSLRDVSGLGWLLLLSPDGTVGTLQKGDHRYVVTQWPLRDIRGRVTEAQNQQIKPAPGSPAPSVARADAPALPLDSGNDSTNPRFNVALRGQ